MTEENKSDATKNTTREQNTTSTPPISGGRDAKRPPGLTTGIPPSTITTDREEDEAKWPRSAPAHNTSAGTRDASSKSPTSSGIGSENKQERGDQRPGGERDSQRASTSAGKGSHTENAASSRMQSEGAPVMKPGSESSKDGSKKSGGDCCEPGDTKVQAGGKHVDPSSTKPTGAKTHEPRSKPTKDGPKGR